MTARVGPMSHVRSSRLFDASILIIGTLLFSSHLALAQFTQQGPMLVGRPLSLGFQQGWSVALSADGNTAIVGGPGDEGEGVGGAWVYTRSAGIWTQQGGELVGIEPGPYQGAAVALSGDGNTAIVGGILGNFGAIVYEAAWIYTRSGGVWSQQGPALDQGCHYPAGQS
jgi:hypothetical protein